MKGRRRRHETVDFLVPFCIDVHVLVSVDKVLYRSLGTTVMMLSCFTWRVFECR